MDYQFRTKPFDHQFEEFMAHAEDIARATFWEQGTGKSKLTIDTLAYLYQQERIEAMLVLAPNGVHRNWVEEEIPKHLPEELLANTRMHTYQTPKCKTKWHQKALRDLWKHKGLIVLAMSYDAIMTDGGRAACWAILKDRKCFYVIDESARIKTPGAKRTKRVIASAKYATYRRALTGTPVTNSPFDVYTQLLFVDPGIWKRHGINTFLGFKTTFGIWQKRMIANGSFDELVEYQHLNHLKEIVDSISSRVTKDEVLDLPERLYSKRTFDLDPKQRRLYDDLATEYMTFLETGEVVTAALAIVRMTRFQQIVCGYLPADGEDEPLVDICKVNPRLSLLKEICEDLEHPTIIFARYTRDVDLIMALLGSGAVRYDGQVNFDDRAIALDRFQKGIGEPAKFFVAKASVAGEGLNLTKARTVIYYSNTFKLDERLQSEARPHRIGQEHPVHYIDIVANGTIDRHISRALASHLDIASKITGDELRNWI